MIVLLLLSLVFYALLHLFYLQPLGPDLHRWSGGLGQWSLVEAPYLEMLIKMTPNFAWSGPGDKIYKFTPLVNFYAPQQYRQVLLRACISYGNSVRLSVTTRYGFKAR